MPQSRPFSEVPTNASQHEPDSARSQRMVALDVDVDGRECAVFRHFVGVHQDAVVFYQTAIDTGRFPSLETALDDLRGLHQMMVEQLGLWLRSKSVAPDQYTVDETGDTALFTELYYLLSADNFPVPEVEAAEMNAMQMLDTAKEDDISPEAQEALAQMSSLFGAAYAYLDNIKSSTGALS